jgi:plasmid maintenance system antidote protein VapI
MDPRLTAIRPLIRSGDITSFGQIFDHIPHTVLAKELGIGNTRMKTLITNPRKMEIGLLWKMARKFKVKDKVLMKVVMGE